MYFLNGTEKYLSIATLILMGEAI